jgi:hypothetical protein
MKKAFIVLSFSLSFLCFCKANIEPLPSGTIIFTALANNVFPQPLQIGDELDFYVTNEVRIAGQLVVPYRARAWGCVTGIEAATADFPAHVFIEIRRVEGIDRTLIEVRGGKMYFMKNPSTASVLTRVEKGLVNVN